MMVNAYAYYLALGVLDGVPRAQLLSHHDFRKAIALAWIDPTQYHPGNAPTPPRPSFSTPPAGAWSFGNPNLSGKHSRKKEVEKLADKTAKAKKRARAVQFTDKTLEPGGILSVCLENTLTHFPVPAKQDAKCQMHRWVGFPNKRSNLMSCEDCHVSICLQCWKQFHTVKDLAGIKGGLAKEYQEDSDKNSCSGARKKV